MAQSVTQLKRKTSDVANFPGRKRLKVLFLNYEFPPSGGGAGNATYYTALELSRRGHKVDVLTARLPNQSGLDSVESMTVHRVYSHRRGVHESGLFGAAAYLATAFRRLRHLARANDYDVYHFYFGMPTGMLSFYVRSVLKKPYIISLRGSDVPGYDTGTWYLQPLHFALRPLSRTIWSGAAAVVAISGHLRALATLTTPKLDMDIIGNAVDTDLFPAKPPSPQREGLRLICVCRLIKRKGIRFLIEAMRQLDNDPITLDIVGTGDLEKEIAALVAASGVGHKITLTGYVPRECLAERYHAADIFVLPSLSESFGQVLLEAMSCGLPIIASRVGGIPETVEHGVNGLLVEAGNAESLAAAIRKLAADRPTLSKMGNRNAEMARTRFTWRSVADRYEQTYIEALGGEPAKKSQSA